MARMGPKPFDGCNLCRTRGLPRVGTSKWCHACQALYVAAKRAGVPSGERIACVRLQRAAGMAAPRRSVAA